MPRNDELVWHVSQLESKVEFLMENLFCKIDRIYEITCSSDRNQHETELLRQEVSLLNARLYSMHPAAAAMAPAQHPCSNCSGHGSEILEALSEAKKALAALSEHEMKMTQNANWKKPRKTYRTPQPAEHLVDVKSIVAKFDTHRWEIDEPDISRPPSEAAPVQLHLPITVTPPSQVDTPDTPLDETPVKKKKKKLRLQLVMKKKAHGS